MIKKIWIMLFLILALALPALAQETPPAAPAEPWSDDDPPRWMSFEKPPLLYQGETPEERKARIGLDVDPGLDPDPTRVWFRKDHEWVIEKYPRRRANYRALPKGYVRPHPNVTASFEIYREDPDWVWVWVEKPEPIAAPRSEEPEPEPEKKPQAETPLDDRLNAATIRLDEEGRALLKKVKGDFAEVIVPASGVTLRFRESSEGLPRRGSWRNGLDVADMNGDGRLDLVVPPQRGGNGFPVIFLGTPEGRWEPWTETVWPVAFNYGTVAAGDLNGDGHQDIVAGAHLMRVFVLLGDGKGTFVSSDVGLLERFPSRRVALGDADGDGDLDIFAISEGPTIGREVGDVSYLRLFLNEEKATRWKEVQLAEIGRMVGGDWLAVDDFDGDGRIDVAGSSVFFNGPDLIYLQKQKGQWSPFGRGWLPFFSYYNALTSGPFTSKKRSDLFLAFRRVWPSVSKAQFEPPALTDVTGIERVSWNGKTPTRETIVSWTSGKPVWALSHGDFDRDGRLDLVYAITNPVRIKFLLGDRRGGFRSAEAEGLEVPDRNLYDMKVADVNGDGADDLALMFEKGMTGSDGSVQVWLGEPARK